MNCVFLDLKIPFLSSDKWSQKGRMEINCSFRVYFKYELNKNVLCICDDHSNFEGAATFFYMHPWFLVRHLINLFISHLSFYWHQGNHYISYCFFHQQEYRMYIKYWYLDMMSLILSDKVGHNCGSIVSYWIWNISIFKWQ